MVWNGMVFRCYVHPATDDPAEWEKIVRWERDGWAALQPFVERAVYVTAPEDGEQRVRDAHRPNYTRLVAPKKTFDPTNLLSSNQNVGP